MFVMVNRRKWKVELDARPRDVRDLFPLCGRFSAKSLFAFTMCSLLACCPGLVQAQDSSRPKITAAYLLNFAKFTDWPPDSFDTAESPIVVCLYGHDTLSGSADELKNRSAQGRPIAVRVVSSFDNIGGCHLLFFSASREAHPPTSLPDSVSATPILTVAEDAPFAIVELYLRADQLRFEISQAALARSGLRISSQVLKLSVAR